MAGSLMVSIFQKNYEFQTFESRSAFGLQAGWHLFKWNVVTFFFSHPCKLRRCFLCNTALVSCCVCVT